jgi:hypothetical protein
MEPHHNPQQPPVGRPSGSYTHKKRQRTDEQGNQDISPIHPYTKHALPKSGPKSAAGQDSVLHSIGQASANSAFFPKDQHISPVTPHPQSVSPLLCLPGHERSLMLFAC